jgi:hypothetical protein
VAEYDADPEPQPIDEDAVWAAIVAGYGEEPADPPGAKPFKSIDDLASLESKSAASGAAAQEQDEPAAEAEPAPADPEQQGLPGPALGASVVFAPGVREPAGPRDHDIPEPRDAQHAEDDDSDDGEGHFVPPEPPPLPDADVTSKFAWLGAIGGPLLALLAVILEWDMTWWLTTVCLGGFLGGIATLVTRMKHDDEEDGDDPGRGAVV